MTKPLSLHVPKQQQKGKHKSKTYLSDTKNRNALLAGLGLQNFSFESSMVTFTQHFTQLQKLFSGSH